MDNSVHLETIVDHFRVHDPKIGKLIETIGPCRLKASEVGFDFLAETIISQQLSMKAADTISTRFRQLFSPHPVEASTFLELSEERVRDVGISGRKFQYITDLASRMVSGEIQLHSR